MLIPSTHRIFPQATGRLHRHGFSLVEILVVLSIASILSLLVATGMQSVLGTAYSNETSDLANTLVRARAYAMANNTYVFVGIQEVDASKPSGGIQTAGKGRVGVTVVASNDGTRGYSTAISAAATIPTTTGTQLLVIQPLRHYENLHLTATSGIANLPNVGTGSSYNLASTTAPTSATALTTFTWPIGSATPQYSFGNNASSPGTVIQFNPQGEAQIVTGANTDSVLQWIEIDLVPTHGSSTSGVSTKNPATILIDGASGNVTTYRG